MLVAFNRLARLDLEPLHLLKYVLSSQSFLGAIGVLQLNSLKRPLRPTILALLLFIRQSFGRASALSLT